VSLQWASDPKEIAADGFHPGESLYRKWAALIAEDIAQTLSKQEQDRGR
jgi:lysophospholipase L1-like esterase